MIRAEVHSDDHKVKASFDATAFFERATLEEVLGLAEIGWGGNYEADGVAQFLEGRDKDVERVFTYLSFGPAMSYGGDPVGFECHVCEGDVARWVKANRPEWFEKVWPGGIGVGEPDGTPYYEVMWGDE